MAKTNLKRMNRFELLELMYRIVTENEQLSQRCAELERQLGYGSRGGDYRSARENPRGFYDEPRTMSRREEILARMDEQTSVPRARREAEVSPARASPAKRAAPSAPSGSSAAPARRRAAAPVEAEEAPSRVRPKASPAAQPAARPAAQPKAPAARPAAQATPRAPARAAQMPPDADFDIDSILEDYFSDLPFDDRGRDA